MNNLTKLSASILVVLSLGACGTTSNTTSGTNQLTEASEPSADNSASIIAISEANYSQAETARNFGIWEKIGANKSIIHMKDLPPRGAAAPTVGMNDDTLYSVVITEAVNGKVKLHVPESDVYLGVQVITEGGHGQYYIVEPGEYNLDVETDFVFIAYRTGTEKGLEAAYATQEKIKSNMFNFGTYKAGNYDYDEVESWTVRLKEEINSSASGAYAFPRTSKEITDIHQWNLENASGWGGSAPEVNVANLYTSSAPLSGDKCMSTTFENPESKYFTSITAYDKSRYLMDGVERVSSYTWELNADDTVTVSFNCGETALNNIDTKGNDFTIAMRYYGVSQKVLDGKVTPETTIK